MLIAKLMQWRARRPHPYEIAADTAASFCRGQRALLQALRIIEDRSRCRLIQFDLSADVLNF